MLENLESRLLLSGSVNVVNYHNDISATGVNPLEKVLTPANVNVTSFGKQFATQLDGNVYTQPLIVGGVTIASGVNTTAGAAGVHDVVIAGTQNDSLYAVDNHSGVILWKRAFSSTSNAGGNQNNPLGATSVTALSTNDVNSTDISPSIGITGTPVIDQAAGIVYVVTKTSELVGGVRHYVQRLHAIRLSDGTDAATPYVIGDTTAAGNNTPIYVYGTGDGHTTDPYNGTGRQVVQFNALTENQRPALSLVNGIVYVEWASHGDTGPYHGWVVAWDVSNVATAGMVVKGVLNTSPNDGLSGIWEGGGGLVFEPSGSTFYFTTGNGSGGVPTLGANGLPVDGNYNEALVKAVLDPTSTPTNQNVNGWGIKVVDFFIPYNVVALDGADSDFGSGAPVLLPDSAGIPGHPHLMVVGGKSGALYVIDRDNLGQYHPFSDSVVNAVPNSSGHTTAPNLVAGLLSTPVWFNNKLYVTSGYNGPTYAFSLNSNGVLTPSSVTAITGFGFLTGSPSLSANGVTNGILWVMDRAGNKIRAYDANTLATELWNSGQAPGGTDNLGAVAKFTPPTIANGMVYVGTADSLVGYGLKTPANAVPVAPVITAATPLSGAAINLQWFDSTTSPNIATGYLIESSTDNVNFTQIAIAAAASTAISVGGLTGSTTYYFRIRGVNPAGNSAYSAVASATTTAQTAAIDFSTGFGASAPLLLKLNGSAKLLSNQLYLTNNVPNQTASVWSASPVDVTQFTTTFNFVMNGTWPLGSGFTFAIQRDLPTAIGPGGSGLGYGAALVGGNGGIPNSVAIKFGYDTGLFTNGAALSGNVVDLVGRGINLLTSYDPMQASMTYNGTTLLVRITDLVTHASATQSYTVNIPAITGGSTAWVGFTGATGALFSNEVIQTWKFASTGGSVATTSPNAPLGLGATPATATSVRLNWTANATNQTGYHLDRATDPAFTQNLITETLPASPASFTDITTGLAPGSSFYYRIRAFNAAGDSANSNVASVLIPLAPPKPSDQSIDAVTDTSIAFSWTDNAGHAADGYNILRAANHGAFSVVATLPPTSRPAPSEYEWEDTGLTPGTFYEYHIVAFNTSGNNDFAGLNATTLPAAPVGLTASAGNGSVALTWSASAGAATYTVERSTVDGGPYVPVATGLTANTFTDTPLINGTPYFYVVTATGTSGEGPASAQAGATPSASALTLDFSSGFANAASLLKINGSTRLLSGKILLTDNHTSEAGSAYALTPQNITGFTTQFDYQIDGTWPLADGFTFVIQRAGLTALGTSGGGLGYGAAATGGTGGIPNSVAIKFDVYSNQGEGMNSTGFYANGAAPTTTASIDLGSTGFNMRSYDPSRATLTYDGTTLNVVLKDLVTGATATQNYNVNIPALIGGTTAWVGFTGSDGSITANNAILNWTYVTSGGPANPTPPAAPTGLNAVGGNGQVGLTWNAVSGATSYNVKYGTSSGVYTVTVPAATNSATISSLANGTPYYFVVTAVGAGGESGNSPQASATPAAPALPGAPTGLNAVAGNGLVALTWNAVSGATSYTVQYGTASGVYTVSVPGISTSGTTIATLANGTPYFFVVSAVSGAGTGGASTEAIATPVAPTPPAAPTGLNAAAGSAQAVLTWNAVAGATSYIVRYGTASGVYAVTVPSVIANTVTLTGLNNGTAYYFVVAAVNAGGPGANSSEASATPSAPSSPGVTLNLAGGFAGNAGKLKLNGAAKIVANDLVLTDGGISLISSAYALDQQNVASFSTQFDFQITGNWPLGDGFTFVIQRAGLTAVGQGGGGLGYGASATGGTGGIPTSLAIKFDVFSNQGEGTNSTGLYLNGVAPTTTGAVDLGLGGFNMRSYDPSRATMTYDGATLTVVLKDLVSGATATQQYAVNIPAVIGGSSAWVGFTAANGALTSVEHILNWTFSGAPATPPAPPTGLAAVAGNHQAALTWNPVSGAASYTISYGTASGAYATTVPAGAGTSTTVTGLTNGTPYYFVVSAANSAGSSGNSAEAPATPVAPLPPGIPTGFAATPGDGQIALAWNPVAGATSYTISYGTSSGSYTATLPELTGANYTLTGLPNGTPYFFVISASNDGGPSGNSAEKSATPAAALPAAPTGLAATAGNGQIALTWNVVPGATYYTVKYGTTSGVYSMIVPSQIAALSYTLGSLTNGTPYYVVISASNSAGEGPNSAPASGTPSAATTAINLPNGFTGAGPQLAINGTARILPSGALSLTDNNTSEAASVYFATQQNIGAFSTQFDFLTTGSWPLGEGFTFVIQRAGTTALGRDGGGLGYGASSAGGTGGIGNSIAIKFDVNSNQGEGSNSTGLYLNGAAPTNAGSVNLDPTGFNLRSYEPSRVTMTYNGTTLTVVLRDLVTQATATQTYTVNIPSLIGGSNAWIGFTAASGSQVSNQQILNWTFTTNG